MTDSTKIIREYTEGKKTLEEVNQALKDAKIDIRLDPEKNVITPEELDATYFGRKPETVNGYGLLDTGTGSFDKVKVVNGVIQNTDCGEMYALLIILDRVYKVEGTKLTTYYTDDAAATK